MNKKSLKIYIAGPYSAETEEQRLENVNAAIDAAVAIFRKGHFPYIPHLTHFVDERTKEKGVDLKWEDYIRWDMPWLRMCDALLYLNNSRGANLELQEAQKLGKKIFRSVNEIPAVMREDNRIKAFNRIMLTKEEIITALKFNYKKFLEIVRKIPDKG